MLKSYGKTNEMQLQDPYSVKSCLKPSLIFLVISFLYVFTSCNSLGENKNTIIVSINPIKYIVEEITCGDFDIEVLVPDGASPENYSPTPVQMKKIDKAELIFTTGLMDFETELIKRVVHQRNNTIVNLSEGIILAQGECEHASHSHHSHGVDPHTWLSPVQLEVIAENVHNSIMSVYPDSTKYTSAYENIRKQISEVSLKVRDLLDLSSRDTFVIYHPALTYYARDYGLSQVSLEHEGKEPSASRMANIAKIGKEKNIKYILYQRQFSKSIVESLCKEIGAEPAEIDPMAENILNEILYITKVIAE